MGNPSFSLEHRTDIPALAERFAATGRVEVPDLLIPEQADRLRASLQSRDDWITVLNAGEKVYELPRAALAAMTPAQIAELDAKVGVAARDGFQFRYDAIRVSDARVERAALQELDTFVDFMSSPPVVDLLASITGFDDLLFADGQATAYSNGHFLTRHDDDVAGKNRRAAYVFGLSPNWRAEWGGLLMFHRPDGNIDEAFTPAMGALRIFAVPVLHSVSYVVPFAPEPRLSVTGWLRTAQPD